MNHVTKPNKTPKTAGWGVRQVTVMRGLFSRPARRKILDYFGNPPCSKYTLLAAQIKYA